MIKGCNGHVKIKQQLFSEREDTNTYNVDMQWINELFSQ